MLTFPTRRILSFERNGNWTVNATGRWPETHIQRTNTQFANFQNPGPSRILQAKRMRILLCLLLLSLARAFLSLYPSSTLSHNSFSETRPIHTGHDRRLCSHGSSHPARKCHVRYRRDNGAAIKLRVADRQQQENVKEESFDISEPPYDNGTTIQSSNVPTKSESPPAAATKETLDDKANYSGEAKMSLDQLKDTVDIVRVVESFHLPGFVRRGEGAVAICPFHEDRNPSLSVDGKRKIFKCFACGAGGDVFRFVQEYSKLPDNNNIALSFGEVVQYISTTFSDGSMGGGGTRRAILNQQLEMERHRKDRIRLANAAASDFYSQCLLQPTAGGARHHLLSRGLSAAAVRSFALGYAPDVYYNNPKNKYPSDWGLGSLVHRLRDLGFSPREVLNSGLATRTKRSLVRNDKATTIDLATNDTVQASEEDYLDYSMLMDRFRGRLMVPIFGKYGKNVVGFGGRSIQSPDSSVDDGEAVSGFKAPKYINSPESEVFEKRNNLFGLNAIQSATKVSSRDSGLILVEGYMDAISLWHAGVENVVATMGTAVAKEQLQLAASTARTLGFRRIIICMDSDDAGNSAVLRLCKNGLLSDCAKTNAIAIEVARLPDGVKDPAEFIEFRREMGSNLTQAADDFRRDVISSSVDWIEWFLQVVVKEYNSEAPSGSTGSFSSIFDTVADFLATSLHPADRAKYAYNAVEQMSGILRQERNLTEIPLVLMYQLEEDMIDATSKISNTKTAISRRTESNDNAVFALVRGHGPTSSEEDNKLSKKSRGKIKGADELTSAKHINDPPSFTQSKGREKRMPTRAILKRHVDLPEESLMPHFAGFRFVHETDNEWLGINRNTKSKGKRHNKALLLGQISPAERRDGQSKGFDDYGSSSNPVYFNSADYNGRQFLTDAAVDAGYEKCVIKPNALVLEHGISSLVEPDFAQMAYSAEESLLGILIAHGPVRTTLKNFLDSRNAVASATDVLWSSQDREWLFDTLVKNSEYLPEASSNPSELKCVLSQLPNTPPGAFYEVRNNENTTEQSEGTNLSVSVVATFGNLDCLFNNLPTSETLAGDDGVVAARRHLAAQEHYMTLVWATSVKRRKEIHHALLTCIENETTLTQNQIQSMDNSTRLILDSKRSSSVVLFDPSVIDAVEGQGVVGCQTEGNGTSTSILPIDIGQAELISKLLDSTRIAQSMKEMARRTTTKLMERGFSAGIGEGRMSPTLQADLAVQLDDHLRELCLSSQFSERFNDGNDEPYEEALERMAEDWGDWFDDDYVWSPGDSAKVETPIILLPDEALDEGQESIEDFMERIDREWADWV